MVKAIVTVLPMLVCGFWALLLSLDIREYGNRGAHLQLRLWAIVSTLLYMGHCAFFNGDVAWLPFFDSLYVACNLAVFPLYLRYLYHLTEGKSGRTIDLLVYIPPLLLGGCAAVLYALMNETETTLFIDAYLYHNSLDSLTGLQLAQGVVHHIAKVIFAVGVVLTLVVGSRKVTRYNRLIDSLYADTDNKRVRGVTTILVMMVATCLVSFVANAIGRHAFSGQPWLLSIPFSIFSTLLFSLGLLWLSAVLFLCRSASRGTGKRCRTSFRYGHGNHTNNPQLRP